MSWPSLKYRADKIEARRLMSRHQRIMEEEKDLRFWTNVGILIAIGIGILTVTIHCWNYHLTGITTAITAFGAALGTGGVLGFLFGVPSPSKAPVNNITSTGPVAVSNAAGSPVTTDHSGSKPPDPPAHENPGQPAAEPPKPPVPASAPPVTTTAHATTTAVHTTATEPANGSAAYVPGVSNLEQVADWVTKLLLGGGLTQMQRIPPQIWKWSYIIATGIAPLGSPAALVAAEQAFAAGVLVYGFILGFFAGFLITKLQIGKAISD